MEWMIRRLERYLEGKNLEVNVGKTKVVRFRKGGGREGKVEWKWKGKEIEEVKEFKYLGYVFKKNGGQKHTSGDRVKKAGVVMRQVWGIEKGNLKRTGNEECGCSTRWCGRCWATERRCGGGKRGRR